MRCGPEGSGARITEAVTVEAPWLTIRYVKQQAFVAHSRTFKLLPSVLEERLK
ncbi:MAG: hypothetical protein WCE68_08600 [Anaerolineales bacterium]